jgi:ankyrin repeat protein
MRILRNDGKRTVACWTLMAMWLLLVNGCATMESVKYEPILTSKFSERPGPAKITRADEKILVQKGYVKLGSVEAFYPAAAGEEKKAHDQLEGMLLREAARQGGDVVRVIVESQPSKTDKKIPDKCMRWVERRKCTYEYVPYQECGVKCVTKSRLENVCRDAQECVDWLYKYETIPGRMSSGTVWRYDPRTATLITLGESYTNALKKGTRADVERLIARGAPLTEPLLDGSYPWQIAASAQNIEAMSALLDRGVKWTKDDLATFAGKGQTGSVKLLLKRGASPNTFDSGGLTALHRAVWEKRIEIVRILLDNGAAVNIEDKVDWAPKNYSGDYYIGYEVRTTPLILAAKQGQTEIAKLLLDHKADIHIAPAGGPNFGKSPLVWAAYSGETGLVKLLLVRGARVDQMDEFGDTAVMTAAWRGQAEVVKILAAHGAKIDRQGKTDNIRTGKTALMEAVCYRPEVETVKVLLALGANKYLKDKEGKTAADLAATAMNEAKDEAVKAKYREIIRLLK